MRYFVDKAAVAMLATLLAFSHAYANDSALTVTPNEQILLFEEIPSVFGASKYEQKLTEAPASVSIVTAEEIRHYGYRNLAELLNSVSGFYMTYDRAYYFPGVRGFNRLGDYNSRILLLVDGYRVNDNVYEQAFVGNETIIDIDLVDRVEVIRGPGSSLYGNNAFFATINIVTKRGRDFQGTSLSLERGSLQSNKGRLSYGNRFENGIETLFSISSYDSAGNRQLYYKEYDDPSTNNGIAENVDGENYINMLFKLDYKQLSMQAGHIAREKELPTAPYDADFNSPHNKSEDPNQHYINARYEQDFGDATNLTARLGYNHYHYHGDYAYDNKIDEEKIEGQWWNSELLVRHSLSDSHTLLAGLDGQDNVHQYQSSFYDGVYYFDEHRSASRWAVYIQDEFRWQANTLLNIGARYDHYSTSEKMLNPRFAVIHNQALNTYKLSYGTAFRAPNFYEMYYHDDNQTHKTNPALRSETIQTWEGSWERQLDKELNARVSLFHYQIKDLISLTVDKSDELFVFDNIEQTTANGLELELEGKMFNNVESRVSYSVQKSENSLANERLTNSPQHLLKLNAAFVLLDRWQNGLEALYSSQRTTRSGSQSDAYTLVNWTISYHALFPNLDASFSVYNLFDTAYSHPASDAYIQNEISQNGREFRLKLTYEL